MKTPTRLQVARCCLFVVLALGTTVTASAVSAAAKQIDQANELNRALVKKFPADGIQLSTGTTTGAGKKKNQPDSTDLARWFADEGLRPEVTRDLLRKAASASKDLELLSEKVKATETPTAFSSQAAANAKLIAGFARELDETTTLRNQLEFAAPDGRPLHVPSLPSLQRRQSYENALKDTEIKAKHVRDHPDNFAAPLRVTVRTKNAQGAEVKNLQVYWRLAPFPQDRAEFNQLSSPTDTSLPAGLYFFWSATIGNQPREGPAVRKEISGSTVVEIDVPAP